MGSIAPSRNGFDLNNSYGSLSDFVFSEIVQKEPYHDRILNFIVKKEHVVLSRYNVIKKFQTQMLVSSLIDPDSHEDNESKYLIYRSRIHLFPECHLVASDSSPPFHSSQKA